MSGVGSFLFRSMGHSMNCVSGVLYILYMGHTGRLPCGDSVPPVLESSLDFVGWGKRNLACVDCVEGGSVGILYHLFVSVLDLCEWYNLNATM